MVKMKAFLCKIYKKVQRDIQMEYIFGKEKIYNYEFAKIGYESVIRWDVLDIKKEQELYLEFISTNSKYKQGVRLAIDVGDGYIEVNGIQSKGVQLWEDTCPKKVKIRCISSEGKLSVYNIFDVGLERGGVKSQVDSSGMLIEKKEESIYYKCNDAGFNTDFSKLEFKIKLL